MGKATNVVAPAKKASESKKQSIRSKGNENKVSQSIKRKKNDDDDDNDDNDDNDDCDEDDEDNDDGDHDDSKDSDDEENDENGSDEDGARKKKRRNIIKKISKQLTKKEKAAASIEKGSFSSSSSSDRLTKLKKLTKLDRLEEARKAYKWWESPDLPEGINWMYLEQPGMMFPPAYVPHNIPMAYNDKPLLLTAEQEEMATFYAGIAVDGPQLGNAETRKLFQKNFFDEFKTMFPDGSVKEFEKCDFTLIREHLDLQKNLRKAATAEEKEVKKADKEIIQLKYAYALVDGRLEKVGNYNMEPPGLFRGRGVHPKTGSLKKRTFPESVSLNLSRDAPPPVCSLPGHAWESVRHDPAVTWLCNWNENVQNQSKYVMLSASSSFKGKSDQDKYGTAIKLKGVINEIRQDYIANLDSKDSVKIQLGVAMWVIDRLALRVGGEKSDAEADTVGCCSLRREHLTFSEDIESGGGRSDSIHEIELEFLGKDSMLYKQLVNFSTFGPIGIKVYECLKSFCRGKGPKEKVFADLTPPVLNKHLNSLLPGLTAKVFRTYNASVTLEAELPSAVSLQGLSVQEKVARYNSANRQVAILCNHQKTVSKATESMFEQLNEKLAVLHRQKNELLEWHKLAKNGKKIPVKADDKDIIETLQDRAAKALKKKESAKTVEEKLAATEAHEALKLEIKKDQARRFEEKHMFKQNASAEAIKVRIDKWTEDIEKFELDLRNRDDNKEVALGTSKINYMDPRISVAWCKRCEVPIEKIFAKTLRDKFNWACAVDMNWKFE